MDRRAQDVLEQLLPGVSVEATQVTRGYQSDAAHQHAVSAIVRAVTEDNVFKKLRLEGGAISILGCSNREVKYMRPGDHACRSCKCSHDASHNYSGACDNMESCGFQCEFLVSNDLLYYQTPNEIAMLLDQHGARAYVALANAPYVGGAGERYGGECYWDDIGGDKVRVVTDKTTMETWEHDSLRWLLRNSAVELPDGRYLAWVPYWGGAQRIAWRFDIVCYPVVTVRKEIPDLKSWFSKGDQPLEQYYGCDMAFTATQVAEALGVHTDSVIGRPVKVKHVNIVTSWLLGNPQNRSLWEQAAAQRCRNIGVENVGATVQVALFLAEQQVELQRTNTWYWWTMARRRKLRASLAYWRSFFFWAPSSYTLNRKVLQDFIDGANVLCTASQGNCITYEPVSIVERCIPTVGKVETERGVLEVDDCMCKQKPAFGLAGIAVCPEHVTTSCACPKTLGTAFVKRVLSVEPEKGMEELKKTAVETLEGMRELMFMESGTLNARRPLFNSWVSRPQFSKRSREELIRSRNAGPSSVLTGAAKAFVKREVVLKPDEEPSGVAADHKPRAIQPVDFARRAWIGPSIYGVTHALKALYCSESSIYFTSGATAEDVGAWFDAARAATGEYSLMCADYGNFDGTNFLDVGQAVALGPKFLCGYPRGTAHLDFANRRATKATYGNRAKYGGADCKLTQYNPTTTSGHDDTTAGNITDNAVVHALTMKEVYGDRYHNSGDRVYEPPADWVEFEIEPITVKDPIVDTAYMATLYPAAGAGPLRYSDHEKALNKRSTLPTITSPAKAAVMGDDGGVVIPTRDAQAYKSAFERHSRSLGYQPEAFLCSGDYEFEFCSMLAWPAADGTVFGPKIGRVMSRTGYKLFHEQRNWTIQLRGDVLGLASTCAHVPILRVWVAKVLSLTGGKSSEKLEDAFKLRASRPHAFSELAWSFASDRYGLSREVLEELEAQVAAVTHLPAVLHHPAWDVIVRRDG